MTDDPLKRTPFVELDRDNIAMREPSYDLGDALRLVLVFHSGGEWDEAKRAEMVAHHRYNRSDDQSDV